MGTVTIQFRGSFGTKPVEIFSAEEGGHAAAIGRAIECLAAELPSAIRSDHELHDNGQHPPRAGFGMVREKERE